LRFLDDKCPVAFAQAASLAGAHGTGAHCTGALAALAATSTCIGGAGGSGVARVLAVRSPSHSSTFR
jgi:hypothetical protein